MIQVSWGAVASIVLLVVAVGPGFYMLGQLSSRIGRNEKDISSIYGKMDEIYRYVKNGSRG